MYNFIYLLSVVQLEAFPRTKCSLASQTHTMRKGLVACCTSVCSGKPYNNMYDNTNAI